LWYQHWSLQGAGRRSAQQSIIAKRWRRSSACHSQGFIAHEGTLHYCEETLFAYHTEILLILLDICLVVAVASNMVSNNYVILDCVSWSLYWTQEPFLLQQTEMWRQFQYDKWQYLWRW
jgi:hypothetical protein